MDNPNKKPSIRLVYEDNKYTKTLKIIRLLQKQDVYTTIEKFADYDSLSIENIQTIAGKYKFNFHAVINSLVAEKLILAIMKDRKKIGYKLNLKKLQHVNTALKSIAKFVRQ